MLCLVTWRRSHEKLTMQTFWKFHIQSHTPVNWKPQTKKLHSVADMQVIVFFAFLVAFSFFFYCVCAACDWFFLFSFSLVWFSFNLSSVTIWTTKQNVFNDFYKRKLTLIWLCVLHKLAAFHKLKHVVSHRKHDQVHWKPRQPSYPYSYDHPRPGEWGEGLALG